MRSATQVLHILLVCVCAALGVIQVSSMEVKCPSALSVTQGAAVTLTCYFTSTNRPSSKTTAEWTFKPEDSGPSQTVMYFYATAYLPSEGRFHGRVRWLGDLSRGDASVQLLNASLSDNGTFSCSIRNPPGDVHGSPGQTQLTVTPRGGVVRFSDVAVLMMLVFVPATIVTLLLLCMMCCPCGSQWGNPAHQSHHSAIEVTDREDFGSRKSTVKERIVRCCDLYLQDSESEDYTVYLKQGEKTAVAESRC